MEFGDNTAFADYDYYTDCYLLGSDAVIPNTAFDYWEKQAEREMAGWTMGRTSRLPPDRVENCIRNCACELAELLYRADVVQQSGLTSGGSGPLASFSNDGESGTYDLTQSDYTPEGVSRKKRSIIYRHLLATGLLYAGVK